MRANKRKSSVLKTCHVYRMLKTHAKRRHVSFHTPGHKIGKWDITELSFSDNLAAPRGCIAAAEKAIAARLGAEVSFLLTDGSTSGIFAMLYAAKRAGIRKIAFLESAHESVYNGCAVLGLDAITLPQTSKNGIPLPICPTQLSGQFAAEFEKADALVVTSPDYYGNIPDLAAIKAVCQQFNKVLLIDGAHGGHLHFDKRIYAGAYADMWVDGVHKSLPALTQGAVVSASTARFAALLREGVRVFRTSSPSYPIMASVEYAVAYPRNAWLEQCVRAFAQAHAKRVYQNDDWTKLCVVFAKHAFAAQKQLERKGIYAEFCDGNVLVFYLSPATTKREFWQLKRRLVRLFARFPLSQEMQEQENVVQRIHAPLLLPQEAQIEWVNVEKAIGRICARSVGVFPPCTPLLVRGERVNKERIALLLQADNVFGVYEGKIPVIRLEDEPIKEQETKIEEKKAQDKEK